MSKIKYAIIASAYALAMMVLAVGMSDTASANEPTGSSHSSLGNEQTGDGSRGEWGAIPDGFAEFVESGLSPHGGTYHLIRDEDGHYFRNGVRYHVISEAAARDAETPAERDARLAEEAAATASDDDTAAPAPYVYCATAHGDDGLVRVVIESTEVGAAMVTLREKYAPLADTTGSISTGRALASECPN